MWELPSPRRDQLHSGPPRSCHALPPAPTPPCAETPPARPVRRRRCPGQGTVPRCCIPPVPQPVLLPVGKVRGVTGGQLGSPGRRRVSSRGKHFSGEIREVIWRKMYLSDKSPCPDLRAKVGEHKSSLLNDNCNCQLVARIKNTP